MTAKLDTATRETFRDLADLMIPGTETMPAGSEIVLHEAVLDHILELRPDLEEDFLRGIGWALGKAPEEAKADLKANDFAAYHTIGLIAASGYYMDPRVRALIGYPGQVKVPADPEPTPDYIATGLLQKVIDRGPIYRPTPKS